MSYQNVKTDVILSVCSSVSASIVEAIAISFWDFPKKHLSVPFITCFCVFLVVFHCLALEAYLYYSTHDDDDDQPSGDGVITFHVIPNSAGTPSSGESPMSWSRRPWVRNAAIDTGFTLVGVAFHVIPHTSVPSLVLLAAVTFDAFAIVKLLYPASHVGLVAAASAVILEIATNVVNKKLVVPFAVVFCAVLIVGRATSIAKSSPHNYNSSPAVPPEVELHEV